MLEQEHTAEEKARGKETTGEEKEEPPKYSVKCLPEAFEDFNKLIKKFENFIFLFLPLGLFFFSMKVIRANIFFYCSIVVVSIIPPLLSPALPTLSHIQFSPSPAK